MGFKYNLVDRKGTMCFPVETYMNHGGVTLSFQELFFGVYIQIDMQLSVSNQAE